MATHRRRQGASRLPVGGAVGAKQDGRGSPMAAPTRALLGFAAAAVSVLTFHQGTWALLHAAGLMPPAPYPTDPVPPFGALVESLEEMRGGVGVRLSDGTEVGSDLVVGAEDR